MLVQLRQLRDPRLALVLAAVLTIGFAALRSSPIPADVVLVERGQLEVTLTEEGETRVRERFVVSAPVAGRVLRIDLEPGDRVRKDETIVATVLPGNPVPLDARAQAEAQAEADAALAALGQARAQRRQARESLTLAESELNRGRELTARAVMPAQDLDRRKTGAREAEEALRAAEYAIRSAESDVARAQARLQAPTDSDDRAFQIYAPIDGVVLELLHESATVVEAGEPILALGDTSDLEVVASFLSRDAVRIQPGQRVFVERWGGDRELRAHVRRISPAGFTKVSALGVEEQRVHVVIALDDPVQAREKLGDGYRVDVRVVVWSSSDVLKIPTTSLFRRRDAWAVYAVEDGRARLRTVSLGQRSGLEAEILAGLEPGMQVLVRPSDRVEEGSRIEVRESS